MISKQLAQAVTASGGDPRKETAALLTMAMSINPGWKSARFAEKSQRAAGTFRDLLGMIVPSYDGKRNRQKIWALLMQATLGIPVQAWQFVCPPKIVLKRGGWVVTEVSNYDIFTPSLEQTQRVQHIMQGSELPFEIVIYYPDEEVFKARKSGLIWETLENSEKERLRDEMDEISFERCLTLQEKLGNTAKTMLWSEVALQKGLDVDQLFDKELAFWRNQGAKGIGFYVETQKWLETSFGFDTETAFELTARRLAKYAVEGEIIATIYPQGSLYLNNEFPFKEPWTMYNAALTSEQRSKMAVLYYMSGKRS